MIAAVDFSVFVTNTFNTTTTMVITACCESNASLKISSFKKDNKVNFSYMKLIHIQYQIFRSSALQRLFKGQGVLEAGLLEFLSGDTFSPREKKCSCSST